MRSFTIPGLQIKSTYIGSPTATTTMSGTSMASPHTAGMIAYLLSLYPSAVFNPALEPNLAPAMTVSNVYALAHAALPSWMTTFIPEPQVFAPTPKDPSIITPKQLKKALLGLSTPDALLDLPKDTVNLLIFNNATL